MLRKLGIVVGLSVVAVVMSGQPNEAANPNKQGAKQSQPSVIFSDGNNKQPRSQTDQPKPDGNPPAGDAPIERPRWWAKSDWWLVVIAGLTGCMVGWQSWETRKAAEAANRALEMGKIKERAKIVLVVSRLNPVLNKIPGVPFTVTNKGESKAFIHSAIGGLHISRSEKLIGNGSGWYLLKIHDTVIAPDQGSVETAVWPGHPMNVYTQEMIEGNGQTWFVHLHGKIAFRDAFEDSWELNFHYIWHEFGGVIYMPPLGNTTGYWHSQLPISAERVTRPKPQNKFIKWLEEFAENEPI
jgi:hypothetical protein